jgi:predicted RNA-binding protein YlxR (DUF448 family)
VRFSKGAEGTIDFGRGQGRGAYVCPSPDCVEKALEREKIGRAWRATVSAEDKQVIRAGLTARLG